MNTMTLTTLYERLTARFGPQERQARCLRGAIIAITLGWGLSGGVLAGHAEALKAWTHLGVLDEPTRAALADCEVNFAAMYVLPAQYVNGTAEIQKTFVKQWLEGLQLGNADRAAEAAAYLGISRAKEAAEPVARLLAEGRVEAQTRWVFVRTLGLTGGRESFSVLFGFLGSETKEVRFYAQAGLAEITGVFWGSDIEKWNAWRMAEAVRELRRLIDENYSYHLLCGVDWDAVFAQYGSRMERARTPEEFAEQAAQLLSRTKDRHISVSVGQTVFLGLRKSYFRNYNPHTLKQTLSTLQEHNTRVSTATIDSDIGYIQINSWNGDNPETLEPAFAAMKEFSHRPNLIVDIRANSGGSEMLARQIAGCFIESPVVYGRLTMRDISASGGWTREYVRTLTPNSDGPSYKGRVSVLMGQQCQSACESFILMMQQTPNCILIGNKSYGSSGNPREYDLGNGVTVRLPSAKMMKADGSLVEQEGIEPDVFVRTNERELRTRDRTLEAAIFHLRRPANP